MTFAVGQEDKNQDQYVISSEQKKKIKLFFDSAVERIASLPELKTSQMQEALPVKGHRIRRTVSIQSSLKLRKKKFRNRCSYCVSTEKIKRIMQKSGDYR